MRIEELTSFLLLISLITLQSSSQNIQMRAQVQEGYYYSHRCEVSIQIVSDYFQPSYQLFHILSKQNAYFFNTIQYLNVFYIKGTNSMEAMMTSSETYCKFPMSTTYYCPFISLTGYDPYGLKYFQPVNSTHRKLTIRLARTICPAQGSTMSFRIQMPVPSDYSGFYMFFPSITNTTQTSIDKLSFVFDQEVVVDLSKLEYKQVREISVMDESVFLVGCRVDYQIGLRFQNISYYSSWDEINVYVTNQQSVELSTECWSNMTLSYSCVRTVEGYRFVNLNQSNMMKSYEIAEEEYYQYDPLIFGISFGMKFVSVGRVRIEVVVKANGNSVQEQWLNMAHNMSEIYGRKIVTLESLQQKQFLMVNSTYKKYNSLKCTIPILISNTTTTTNSSSNSKTDSTNNSTSNSTTYNSTTSNDSINNINSSNHTTTPNFDNNIIYDTSTYSFQLDQLVFIAVIILILSITLICTKNIHIWQKLFYLITILLLSLTKILYLTLPIDQTYLITPSTTITDSLLLNNTKTSYSLELFILKYTFILQLLLNLFYLFNYLILLICSQQIISRIKKFYGTKQYIQKTLSYLKQTQKIHHCNFSTIVFTFITFFTFLLSFKIYALLIFKLQLNLNPTNKEFNQYRLKNSIIYKMHAVHLAIDLLLEINAIIWLFSLIKNSQNPLFTPFLYAFLVVYCVHVYLIAAVLKVFFTMAHKTNKINSEHQNNLKNASLNLQQNMDYDENQDNQKEQEKNEQNNVPTQRQVILKRQENIY